MHYILIIVILEACMDEKTCSRPSAINKTQSKDGGLQMGRGQGSDCKCCCNLYSLTHFLPQTANVKTLICLAIQVLICLLPLVGPC